MLVARIALEHVGMVAARAVRFRVAVKVGLLGMHGVAIRAGNGLVGFGCRQIVRVDRRAVRISKRRNRRRLLGKLALIMATEAHLARHLGLLQAGRLAIVGARAVVKLGKLFGVGMAIGARKRCVLRCRTCRVGLRRDLVGMACRAIGARRPVGQRDAFRRSCVGLARSVARLGGLAAIQGQHQNRHRAHYGTRRAHFRFAFVSNRSIHFSPFRWLRRIRRETYATIGRRKSPQANELRLPSS